jgi:hypothetical protein
VVDLPGFARPLPPWPPPHRSEFEVVVRDQDGAVLARSPAPVSPPEVIHDDLPELVEAEIPWRDDAAVVELCRRDVTLARMPIDAAPELDVGFPPLGELDHGRGTLSYRTRGKAERCAVAIRASRDGGVTWTAIVSQEREGKVDVSTLLEGSGDECLLEVLASSGYHTAVERSEPFRVRPREQSLLVWSSAAGGRLKQGETVELFAIGDRGAATASEIAWCSDLDGELGQGVRLTVALRPGRHRIEVRSRTPFQQPAWLELDVD